MEESAWAFAFGVLLLITGSVRGMIWIIQRKNERQDQISVLVETPADSGLAPNLPKDFKPTLVEVGILLAAGVLCAVYFPIGVPVVLIGGGVLMLHQHGVSVLQLWQWNSREIGSYLVQGMDRYLLIVVPMALLTAGSALAFKLAGATPEPQPVIVEFLQADDHRGVITLLVMAVVIAPLWEEIVFRGILYPLLRGLQNRIFAVLVTGILFGLLHDHPPAYIPLAFLGIILAWCYEKTGKLGYCIALHACFNAATAIGLLLIKYAPSG
ncbi:MAG: CPBP family intramembrane glutamic endopeptidase [Verrucomicrobiota bacterium]